jgi:hypothetical protein
MADVIGVTLVKINGIFELDVTNARWSDGRALVQHVTGGGVKKAKGTELPSGSFDEVVSRSGATNWRNLSDFRMDVYDKETRSIIVASFSGCDWEKIDGSSDNASATTKKSIGWKGTDVNTI